jgi:hypothetical protein
MNARQSNKSKKTFVPPTDRPEVKLAPDSALSDPRIRDLANISGEQITRREGTGIMTSKVENLGFVQKCIEKWPRDIHGLISSPPPGVPGLKELIEAECALVEEASELSQTLSTVSGTIKGAGV